MINSHNVGDGPLRIRIAPKNADGGPARIDGAPTYGVQPEGLGVLSISDDQLSAVFEPRRDLADLTPVLFTVSADADLGEGVRTLTGARSITLVPLEAVVFDLDIEPAA